MNLQTTGWPQQCGIMMNTVLIFFRRLRTQSQAKAVVSSSAKKKKRIIKEEFIFIWHLLCGYHSTQSIICNFFWLKALNDMFSTLLYRLETNLNRDVWIFNVRGRIGFRTSSIWNQSSCSFTTPCSFHSILRDHKRYHTGEQITHFKLLCKYLV